MDDRRWMEVVSAMRGGPPKAEPRTMGPIIHFHTPWERLDDGWSVAARAYARAMEIGGVDVRLVSWKPHTQPLDPEVVAEAGRFAQSPPREWDLHVYSCFLAGAEHMVSRLENLRANPGPQAYHCVFERCYIEPDLARALNLLDSVWAQCSANRDVLVEHGVKNVTLIYQPYFDDDPHLSLPAPTENKRFYWIGRFEPRKAPDNLLRAFMRAFRPGEAKLTMKLSALPHAHPYISPVEVIEEQLGSHGWTKANWEENICLIGGKLTKKAMLGLHAQNDVYVSASRGEGLELGGFAAKLAGRSLVVTDSGGPRDYVNEGDILVPAKGLIPAPEEYRWGPGANYIDYDLDDLVEAFQSMRAAPVRGSRLDDKFKAANVGRCFREWVERLMR